VSNFGGEIPHCKPGRIVCLTRLAAHICVGSKPSDITQWIPHATSGVIYDGSIGRDLDSFISIISFRYEFGGLQRYGG
jgi:hypothetical protein